MPLNKRWTKIVFTIRKCISCREILKKHFSSSPYSFSQSVCLSVVWIEGGVVKCLDILWVTQLTMTKISFEVFLGKISKNLWPWNIPTIQNSYVHSREVTPQPMREQDTFILKHSLGVSNYQSSDPWPLSIQLSDSIVCQFQSILIRRHRNNFRLSTFSSFHSVVHKGQGQDVDIHWRLQHNVLHNQQFYNVGFHILRRRHSTTNLNKSFILHHPYISTMLLGKFRGKVVCMVPIALP